MTLYELHAWRILATEQKTDIRHTTTFTISQSRFESQIQRWYALLLHKHTLKQCLHAIRLWKTWHTGWFSKLLEHAATNSSSLTSKKMFCHKNIMAFYLLLFPKFLFILHHATQLISSLFCHFLKLHMSCEELATTGYHSLKSGK